MHRLASLHQWLHPFIHECFKALFIYFCYFACLCAFAIGCPALVTSFWMSIKVCTFFYSYNLALVFFRCLLSFLEHPGSGVWSVSILPSLPGCLDL